MPENTQFIFSQILAGIGFVLGVLGFSAKDHKHTLLYFILCSIVVGIHFLLLEADTAAVVVLLTAVRHATALFSKRKIYMFIFLLLTGIIGVFTYKSYLTLLAMLAGSLGTIASFSSAKNARRIWMCGSSTYALHNFLVWSPVAMLMEIVFLITNVISYRKYHRE